MIDLRSGLITDLLSNSMRYNPETIAMGYAVLQEKQRLMELADRTRLMSQVETLDEQTLDYLAVELRTPAYHDSYPLNVKRRLIAGTLPFYAKLGTPAAVDWAIKAIFGSGYIEEWFDYDGDPHHFRAYVGDGRPVDPKVLAEFRQVLADVKRLSSWLDEIIITLAEARGQISAAAHLGPRQSESRLPRFRGALPPGKFCVTPVLGASFSTITLPMAVGRPPDRSFAGRPKAAGTVVRRSRMTSPANDGPMAAHEGG